MKQTPKYNDAVSPVVGVMLMLVVTIILAAVVSGFAGGVFSSVETPTQATFSVTPVIDTITDTDQTNAVPDSPSKANNGIQFRHTGGDTIFLEDITIQLKSDDKQMNFNLATKPNTSSIVTAPVVKTGGENTYFSMGGTEYTELNAGDAFTLLADSCYDSTKATDSAIVKGRFLIWSPASSSGTFTAQTGKDLTYSIIETASGTTIQRGVIKI